MGFTPLGLNERLLKALDHLKLVRPTPVQEALIPVALQGRDVQASAETGSGKTAAYVLPILHRMLADPQATTATRALFLLPTRELAMQVEKHCRDLAGFTMITTGVVVGGTPYGEQKAMIRKNPEILVGTPGRVLEHVSKRSIVLDDLEYLVLDEADRMLDMGFRDEVLSIVQACPPGRQSFLLSATLAHEGIAQMAAEVLREPEIISIGTHRSAHANIRQQLILADDPGHKNQLVNWLLANTEFEKAIIFTNTREQTENLCSFLQSQRDRKFAGNPDAAKKSRIGYLHGEMSQDDRKRLMHWFRTGVIRTLVSTDLAARGLDVKGVDLVINHSVARSGDDHVHRIGRTGRAGASGLAITLVVPQEWNQMKSIERYLKLEVETRTITGLESRFKGPAQKSAKKTTKDRKPKKKVVPKAKQRHTFKKNIGKRRQPAATPAAGTRESSNKGSGAGEVQTGFEPLKKKT
jgi:ATP-dependent RNA helicase SrmB